MIASVYIKDGNIHFYNEQSSLSGIGGLAYELGRPLLDFVCYEPERFAESFSVVAETYDNEYAHMGAQEPEFRAGLKESMNELQQKEIYISFYAQMLLDFVYSFIESPQMAVMRLEENIPGASEKLSWAIDFEWPAPSPGKVFYDKEKRLFRAAKDVVELMHNHLCRFQTFIRHEIEVLLHYRKEVPVSRSIDYIDILDEYHDITIGGTFYLEHPFRVFYGRVAPKKVEQLY